MRRCRLGSLGGQLIQDLRHSLVNAEALKKFDHGDIHLEIDRDAVLQLDGHQRIQAEMAEGLVGVQLGGG